MKPGSRDGRTAAHRSAPEQRVPDPGSEPEPALRERDLRSAFENAPIGMAVLTPLGVLTSCNRALGALLGRPPQALVGRTLFEVTHADDLAGARRACERVRKGGAAVLRHRCRLVREDGTTLHVLVSTSRVPDLDGAPAHLVMHVEDVSDRTALEAGLTHRALHDGLTGLPNRMLLMDRLGHALAARRRTPGPLSLLFLDLNGFKDVNDTHGHAAGDVVLQEFAGRLSAVLRPLDTAARLGGDEFAVLCPETGAQEAARIAQRLQTAAAAPFALVAVTLALTTAVGVVTIDAADPAGPDDADTLLSRADRRMYEVKRRRDRAPRPPLLEG